MAFYNNRTGPGDFVADFRSQPERGFGVFGRGYAEAAKQLTQSLLARAAFRDYEAYPVVFLYRHALELYLKVLIVKGVHLNTLAEGPALHERLVLNHDLRGLFRAAHHVVGHNFPRDTSLKAKLDTVERVVQDFADLDSGSFRFRYPIDKSGQPWSPEPVYLNLGAIAETMDGVLEDLDTIEFGMGLETELVEDILAILLKD